MICPRCGARISPFDLKPNCKNCSANIMLYSQEKGLVLDAKKTELEFTAARIIVNKIKAAYVQTAPAILRMAATLLCAAAVLIPSGSVSVKIPFASADISAGAIGIYKMFSDGLLTSLPAFLKVEAFGGSIRIALCLTAAFALAFLCALAVFLTELLAFANIKRVAKVMIVESVLGAVFSASEIVIAAVLKIVRSPAFISASFGFGGAAALAAFLFSLIMNFKIWKNGLPVRIKEGDVVRKEIYDRIKRGETTYDELPLPVYETPEEKARRIEDLEKLRREGERNG